MHLLLRGEDPRRIRILDIHPPTRLDIIDALSKGVDFMQVDISDATAVDAAFQKEWPFTGAGPAPAIGTSVFHAAASIRFYERHPSLVPRSAKVNVQGTQNILSAARSIGATALVYTSSGSIFVRRTRFWLWPWEHRPDYSVQVISDDDDMIPKRPEHFFSNYALTKAVADRCVREADGKGGLRTGCIRPGNGIFGPGDMLCGADLVRKTTPTWISNTLHHFVYVENCSLAHL